MKAYVLRKPGPPESLNLESVTLPAPGPGMVRVKISTIGLNYAEVQSRKGLYGWAPPRPYIPGMEAYGQIMEVGEQVTEHVVGDAVIAVSQYGCYAEEVILPQAQVLPALDEYSPEENASFAVQFMTAWVGLMEICRLKGSDKVLIQAAAGGVGTAAVQIAKAMGCEVFGTTSSHEKCKIIHKLGAQALNYSELDFAAAIRSQNHGKGVDVILEVVGGDVFKKSLDLLNPFGRMAVIGFASLNLVKWNPASWLRTWRSIPRVKIDQMATRSHTVGASHLGYLLQDTERMMKIWNTLCMYTRQHNLRPVVGHVYNFEDLAEAHRLMESRKSHGKIILKLT